MRTQAKNFKGKFWAQLGMCSRLRGKRSNFKVKTLRKVLQLLSALFLDEMGIKIPSSLVSVRTEELMNIGNVWHDSQASN